MLILGIPARDILDFLISNYPKLDIVFLVFMLVDILAFIYVAQDPGFLIEASVLFGYLVIFALPRRLFDIDLFILLYHTIAKIRSGGSHKLNLEQG